MKRFLKSTLKVIHESLMLCKWLILHLLRENSVCYLKLLPRGNTSKQLCILANGPSLNSSLLTLDYNKADIDYLVVNDFYKSEVYNQIKPKYYVLADPLYFSSQFNKIEDLIANTSWEMTLIVPFWTKKIVEKVFQGSKYVKVCYNHSNPYEGFKNVRHWLYKKGLSTPSCQNVLVPSLMVGINLGYKYISIYGADHSWIEQLTVNEKNQVCQYDRHFYEDKVELKPWYMVTGEPYNLHTILETLSITFKSHKLVQEYAVYRNCSIINKTPKSWIDAYPRE